MTEAAENLQQNKTQIEAFLAIPETGNLVARDIFELERALQTETMVANLGPEQLENLKLRVIKHLGRKNQKILELGTTLQSNKEYALLKVDVIEPQQEMADSLEHIVKTIDQLILDKQAGARHEKMTSDAKRAIEVATATLPEGDIDIATLIATLAEALDIKDVRKLGSFGAMLERTIARDRTAVIEPPVPERSDDEKLKDQVAIIKQNSGAVGDRFGGRFAKEATIDQLATWASSKGPTLAQPLFWLRSLRGFDPKARLAELAKFAERSSKEEEIMAELEKFGMNLDFDWIFEYFGEAILSNQKANGIADTFEDEAGEKHELRGPFLAHLLIMADFKMIKPMTWMQTAEAMDLSKKVMDQLGTTYSAQLREFYTDRLPLVTKYFPQITIDYIPEKLPIAPAKGETSHATEVKDTKSADVENKDVQEYMDKFGIDAAALDRTMKKGMHSDVDLFDLELIVDETKIKPGEEFDYSEAAIDQISVAICAVKAKATNAAAVEPLLKSLKKAKKK